VLSRPSATDTNWTVVGEKFSVDAAKVSAFFQLLGALQISEFVKDLPGSDLESFGLATNTRSITLRFADGSTNALLFGGMDTNKNQVFVKRLDENFIYGLALADVGRLPDNSWEFRERRLWNFSLTNLAQITLHQGGRTRQIVRIGDKKWGLAPGSQGILSDLVGLEETAKALSSLTALGWAGRNITDPARYGFETNSLQLNLEMKTGETFTVDFGAELQGQTALAAVTLDGERWAFVFPPGLWQLVTTYLSVPANKL
jgi:hypothetical protein